MTIGFIGVVVDLRALLKIVSNVDNAAIQSELSNPAVSATLPLPVIQEMVVQHWACQRQATLMLLVRQKAPCEEGVAYQSTR
ncbi:predicted protein [Lichtheimia corymbifera JMRC:FSU:9682]|uniref:Uncharacterized protein n=1 Tax=Lichtheimia corymbifera JMRC:FSU:9682 TaxID=1263082 RepID=A0A068RM52_9FUNG|nr:predicted protein [Lichtheimia corymbifera JMRC:FSU:9682]